MKAIIQIDVPDHQIGQEVSIYFKDTMMIKGVVKEQSGDLISRDAVLDIVDSYSESQSNVEDVTQDIISDIVVLSSVNPQEPKTEKVIKMRDATPEERESIDKYIKSISKPTGVNFWDLEQEPKMGKWIYGEDNLVTGRDGWYCNQCGHFEFWDYNSDMKSAKLNLPNICPNCESKMQEVEE